MPHRNMRHLFFNNYQIINQMTLYLIIFNASIKITFVEQSETKKR
jgi:hypothetical protein